MNGRSDPPAYRDLEINVAGRRLLAVPELVLDRGKCLLLTGRNGSGKTTLLKIMAGLQRPARGRIILGGRDLTWRKARRVLHQLVIYSHQQPYLFNTTVYANIEYGLKQARIPVAVRRKRVTEALAWARLGDLAARNARSLSGGERQLVALTRAKVLAPTVLLLDEPIANLDLEARERTYFLIRRLKAEGISLMVTSHETQQLVPLTDGHLHIEGGRLIDGDTLPAGSSGNAIGVPEWEQMT